MLFAYKAKDSSGKDVEGVLEAKDKYSLAHELKKNNLTVVSVKKDKGSDISFLARINESVVRVGIKDRIFFASNLSEMVSAGLTLSRALGVLARQTKNAKLKKVIADISESIDKGETFSASLAKHPDIFEPVFIAMVDAGEQSGRLPEALKTISEQMEKSYSLRKRVRGAMMYPAIIILAMIGIAIAMLVFVVPTLAETFEDIGAELPATTKFVIGTSSFLANHYIILILSVLVLLFFWYRFNKTKTGKRVNSFIFLHVPLIKGITTKMNSAMTARTLSALVASGVEIVEALNITERVLQNPYYKDVLSKAKEEVPKGATLSSIFQKHEKIYPPFVGEMVSVGEETGKMTEMLSKLAIFYENEVDATTKDLSTIVEPIIMIVVGVGVGFFALSMIQPIYSIGTTL